MQQVSIIGGGIAGLTLGILLREGGVPVQLWEAHGYPRHRVCGEFINGAGADLLAAIVPEVFRRSRLARTVRFFTDGRATGETSLPCAGFSISRWELDQMLADRFVGTGGELVTHRRWMGKYEDEGIVRATGRRMAARRDGWVGLKAHFESFEAMADLEMHFTDQGYVGISRLPEGANVCALVNSSFALENFRAEPWTTFARLLGPAGAERLSHRFDPDSVCAVSGLSFTASNSPEECCVGDGIRMIPPFTGNGMSIAVESAFAAAAPLAEYSAGARSWPETLMEVNSALRKLLSRRFMTANFLHQFTNRSWTRLLMLSGLRTFRPLLPLCFKATR